MIWYKLDFRSSSFELNPWGLKRIFSDPRENISMFVRRVQVLMMFERGFITLVSIVFFEMIEVIAVGLENCVINMKSQFSYFVRCSKELKYID